MSRTSSACALAIFAALSAECAPPTAVRVEVFSDLPCSEAALFVAPSLAELSDRAPASVSSRCTPDPSGMSAIGDVIATPAGATDTALALAVAQRVDGLSPEGCVRAAAAGDTAASARCVVARRQLRTAPHETLTVRVDLRQVCAGAACPNDQTCVRGLCVASRLPDGACAPGCGEGALRGAAGSVVFEKAAAVVTPASFPRFLTADRDLLFWGEAGPTGAAVLKRWARADAGAAPVTVSTSSGASDLVRDVGTFHGAADVIVLVSTGSNCIASSVRRAGGLTPGVTATVLAYVCDRVAATPTHVFLAHHGNYSNGPGVERLARVGGSPTTVERVAVITQAAPVPLTAVGTTVFWFDVDTVWAASPADAEPRAVARKVPRVVDLTTDGKAIYALTAAGTVHRAPLAAEGWSANLLGGPPLRGATRLVVDDTHVYAIATEPPFGVYAAPKDTTAAPEQVWGELPAPDSLAVDDRGVTWVAAETGAIWMAAKQRR